MIDLYSMVDMNKIFLNAISQVAWVATEYTPNVIQNVAFPVFDLMFKGYIYNTYEPMKPFAEMAINSDCRSSFSGRCVEEIGQMIAMLPIKQKAMCTIFIASTIAVKFATKHLTGEQDNVWIARINKASNIAIGILAVASVVDLYLEASFTTFGWTTGWAGRCGYPTFDGSHPELHAGRSDYFNPLPEVTEFMPIQLQCERFGIIRSVNNFMLDNRTPNPEKYIFLIEGTHEDWMGMVKDLHHQGAIITGLFSGTNTFLAIMEHGQVETLEKDQRFWIYKDSGR